MNTDSVAQDQIRAFFERWQRLEEEKVAISGDLKELFAEAKANGFDTKVLRKLFRDQVADSNERSEFEALYDLYAAALSAPRVRDARDAREDEREHDAIGVIEESTAARKDVQRPAEAAHVASEADREIGEAGGRTRALPAGTQAPPVDTSLQNLQTIEPGAAMLPQTVPAALPVPEASTGHAAVESPALIADISKPNPICRDPDDCGVYASWHLTCEKCKAAAALRSAA